MNITYQIDVVPELEQIIAVYASSGINRPINDSACIKQMYDNSNLIVTAWHQDKLIGIARSLTDFCFCCYLSDLAVAKDYQHHGIGKKLVELTKQRIGEHVMLLLLAAPSAINYYPKIGFEKVDNGFIIKRIVPA